MTTHFDNHPVFGRELARLTKKYRSLTSDLKEFKLVLIARPLGAGKHFNIIAETSTVAVVKARLFCQSLKRKSLRIIYAYHESPSRFEFLEIYFKGDKESEDKERISQYLMTTDKD